MALRFLLVGLVAVLGSDLPDAESLARAARAGQGWVMERVATVAGMLAGGEEVAVERDGAVAAAEPEAESVLPRRDSPTIEVVDAGDAEPSSTVPSDEAFASVVDAMVGDFAAGEPEAVVATVEQVVEVVESYRGVAFELNRLSDGVDDGWMADADGSTGEAAVAEASIPAAEPAPVAVAMISREERLDQAVHLTGQALQAWFSVLQQNGPIRVSGR
jgi:hypothetical protein